jgi:2'-5' RNA ligase
MSSPGSVAGDATHRVFCALELPADVRADIATWAGRAVDWGRPVPIEKLHVTLAFLGACPTARLETVAAALAGAADGAAIGRLELRSWRTTRSVGMIVLADPGGDALRLQAALRERLATAGLPVEHRPWLPHLTVVRHRAAPGAAPADLPARRTFVPSGAAAFLSRLHPSGSRYELLARVPLEPLTQEDEMNEVGT